MPDDLAQATFQPAGGSMEKSFDPVAVERRWYPVWEERGYFTADPTDGGPAFAMASPPPNITGELHMGHALNASLQDALARWKRMTGHRVLWLPGTDHAAIATQNAIERQLAAEGTSKEAMGREAFADRVQAWYAEVGSAIVNQLRRIGASMDWSRERFTMDEAYSKSVLEAFVLLHRQGLIYRGPRLVNWCPRCRSAISDLEVEHEEREDSLYYIRYRLADGSGHLTVATVRPETMLADSAVAVHPEDPRFRELVGRMVVLPVVGRQLPVIGDSRVEREFGTGALKVTPGHDPVDYEIGQRHGLAVLSMLTSDGHVDFPEIPALHGLSAEAGRAWMVERLEADGALDRVEPYRHSVGHCDRCGHTIEPLISEQWWCRMDELAVPAIRVVEDGEIRFHPSRYGEVYLHWMANLRDWCVSRQLWLGHRIPVYTCPDGHVTVAVEPPPGCPECGADQLTQDPDVLDTWFSSALWPFATLGWPEQTQDLAAFYPTSVLSTAREIIFLWVSRMIMTGLRFQGQIPFSDVLIHAVVQATDGQRMSKSKGNGVDPLALVDRHGADAVRMWCLSVAMNKQDVRFSEEKIGTYRGFANKLWNATRLLLEVLQPPTERPPGQPDVADRWILARLDAVTAQVEADLERFDFSHAVDLLYEFVWHEFCDWYLEIAKVRQRQDGDALAAHLALEILERSLRLLHPFMPFITEDLWQRLPAATRGSQRSIMLSEFPRERGVSDPASVEQMERLFEVVRAVRNARQQGGHDPRGRGRLLGPEGTAAAIPAGYLSSLAGVDLVEEMAEGEPLAVEGGNWRVDFGAPGERAARMGKELAQAEADLARVQLRLGDPAFVERAPAQVVERERQRQSDAQGRIQKLRDALAELG